MRVPDFLVPGDKIGVVAPAGRISYPDDISAGLDILSQWGLDVVEGSYVSGRYFQFAGTDDERRADLQRMLDSPEIKAIICVRGGYGCSRIIDRINFDRFAENPKWLIGFSDITLVLNHIQNMGVSAIHGPMLKQFGKNGSGVVVEFLRKLLFGEPLGYQFSPHALNRRGRVNAVLTGGNLCLTCHSIGSVSETVTSGKILFLEDVGEELYNIDRMMWQLRRAGKLDRLVGLLVGSFSETKGTIESFGQSACEIIWSQVRDFKYPLAFGIPSGHISNNHPLVMGAPVQLNITDKQTEISWPARLLS